MPGTEGDVEALYATARSQYAYFDPARKNAAFMENAGGSQVQLLRVEASNGQQTRCISHRVSLCGSKAGRALWDGWHAPAAGAHLCCGRGA